MRPFPTFLKLIKVITTSYLIFASCGFMLAAGGATLFSMRNFDTRMGWLKAPTEAVSNSLQRIYSTPAEAQFGGGPCFTTLGPCLSETSFQIEVNLQKILRQLVMSFIQGLVNFLKSAFLDLLEQMEKWAGTVFGLRLNLCNVKRFVATQFALQFNQLNGTAGDKIFGPMVDTFGADNAAKETMKASLANAGAAVDLAAATEVADRENPGCAASRPIPSSARVIESVSENMSQIAQRTEELRTEAVTNDGITNVIYPNLMGKTNIGSLGGQEQVGQLQTRAAAVAEGAKEAISSAESQAPSSCPTGIIMADKTEGENGEVSIPENYGNFDQSNNRSTLLARSATVVAPLEVQPLTNAQCEATDTVKAAQNSLETTASANSASSGEGLVDAILSVVQDFFKQIFEKIKDLIGNLINKVISKITNFIQDFAQSNLGSLFGDFSESVEVVTDALDDVGEQLARNLDEIDFNVPT